MLIEDRSCDISFSRRGLLLAMVLAPLPALLSCKTPRTGRPDPADVQLQSFADSYATLARREPTLPGIRSLAAVDEQLFAGLDTADASLLAAALYFKARDKVAARTAPLREADVRAAFSRPIDLTPYGRAFLDRTLAEGRARMVSDREYRQQVESFRRFPPGAVKCVDVDTGVSYSLERCAYLLDIGVFQLA